MGVATSPAAEEVAAEADERFRLVGYGRFVRTNPRSDRFRVLGFHHVEFWAADATSAAGRFSFGLGMPLAAVSGLATGNPVHASLLLRSGELQFLFSAPYGPVPAGDLAGGGRRPAIPSFDADSARRFSAAHGLAVRAIAVRVADAFDAFHASVAGGARPAFPPTDLGGGFALSEVELYGDVVLRYISGPQKPPKGAPFPSQAPQNPSKIPPLGLETEDSGAKIPSFLPGFEDLDDTEVCSACFGLRRLDHAVGNVADLGEAVKYIASFTGFHEFAEFTAEDVGTAESGLNSVVLANNDENVLIPLNEPVHGTKRRSQIQTYLDYNGGAGLQHLALASDDVLKTLREMRKRSKLGGFEFMASPPPNYYDGVRRRAGDVLTEEQIRECQELGVLVDRDDQGVLLQIFTKPVGDRPTIFLEIIQRIGCMMNDNEGREYQKGGCGGFGKGNFSELFKSIEEFEKSLEGKQQTAVPTA